MKSFDISINKILKILYETMSNTFHEFLTLVDNINWKYKYFRLAYAFHAKQTATNKTSVAVLTVLCLIFT